LNTSGKSFFSEKKALLAVVGETIERFNWSHYNPDIYITDSVYNVEEKAFDLSSLAGFSEEQKRKNKNFQHNEHSIFQWVKADELVSGREILCPAQLISPRLFEKTHYTNTSLFTMLKLLFIINFV